VWRLVADSKGWGGGAAAQFFFYLKKPHFSV